ncbi:MAG TPA: hypothetical protein VH025_09875, partial [Solirubrobacteraceae bacterium]|nr:hypothetical protein [Solirubrobacteraceae bacterium]
SNGTSFADKIKKYEKQTHTQPANVVAWQELSKALLHEAGQEGFVDQSTGSFTTEGHELINRAGEAWERYIALNPAKPNSELAYLVANDVYSEAGRNEPSKAVAAMQIVVAAFPDSASRYALLAEYAYKAKNESVGDQAAKRAVALAPASERASVKSSLEAVKKNPSGEEELTTTTNGKTFKVKTTGESGTFTGTEVKSTTAPTTSTGSTSTTKTSSGTSKK